MQEKKVRKQVIVSLVAFLLLLILSIVFFSRTASHKINYPFMPYYLTRILLLPIMLFCFGFFLSKVVICFWGRPRNISTIFSGTVKSISICIVSFNIIVTLPYIIWCIKVLLYVLSGTASIEMSFPYVVGYSEIVNIFLTMMYEASYIYVLPGFCIGAFTIRQQKNPN